MICQRSWGLCINKATYDFSSRHFWVSGESPGASTDSKTPKSLQPFAGKWRSYNSRREKAWLNSTVRSGHFEWLEFQPDMRFRSHCFGRWHWHTLQLCEDSSRTLQLYSIMRLIETDSSCFSVFLKYKFHFVHTLLHPLSWTENFQTSPIIGETWHFSRFFRRSINNIMVLPKQTYNTNTESRNDYSQSPKIQAGLHGRPPSLAGHRGERHGGAGGVAEGSQEWRGYGEIGK